MATVNWHFAFLLPHARLKEPIERGPLAFVPASDSRLIGLAKTVPSVGRLVSRITDQFGRKVEPSAVLIRSDVPKSIDFHAIVSFRNTIAICGIIDAWVRTLANGNTGTTRWSDYFDFYAFTAGKDDWLNAFSAANHEVDHAANFCGQRAPHLPPSKHLTFEFDHFLLDECLRQWDRMFLQNRARRKLRVLFRSIEIACLAMRVPGIGTREPSIHDYGIGIALWVSAFEILSHPGNAGVNLNVVLDVLSEYEWIDPKLRSNSFIVNRKKKRGTFAQKLYFALYTARNAFLHGNRVTQGKLFPMCKPTGPSLLACAPLLYRVAVLKFLSANQSLTNRQRALDSDFSDSALFRVQHEDALLKCNPNW